MYAFAKSARIKHQLSWIVAEDSENDETNQCHAGPYMISYNTAVNPASAVFGGLLLRR